jgi:hypothetical protein
MNILQNDVVLENRFLFQVVDRGRIQGATGILYVFCYDRRDLRCGVEADKVCRELSKGVHGFEKSSVESESFLDTC